MKLIQSLLLIYQLITYLFQDIRFSYTEHVFVSFYRQLVDSYNENTLGVC